MGNLLGQNTFFKDLEEKHTKQKIIEYDIFQAVHINIRKWEREAKTLKAVYRSYRNGSPIA